MQYATNEAGDVLEFRGGDWVKVPQATNEQGQILFYMDDQWKPAPRRVQEGLLKTEKAKLSQRAINLGMDPRELFEEPVHTPFEEQAAGFDKGLEDVPYGAAQLAAHLPGVPQDITESMDDAVTERERYAPNNLGQFTGNVIGMAAPGGAAVKGVRAAGAGGMLAEAAAGGAAEGLTMPVTGDNYASEKAMQVGTSAGLSTGTAGGIRAATRGGEGVANIPRTAENLPGQLSQRQVRRGTEMATEGDRLAREHGVDLTPGQSSDSATLKFLEQRARQSWLSKEAALEGDSIRAAQMKEAIENQAGNTDSAKFAARLQSRLSSFVRGLAKRRSENGRAMYGEIDRMAQGQKIVQPRALYDELSKIIQEAGTQEAGDVVTAARQARKMLDTIDEQGAYSAQEALGRLQAWSPYSKGTVFDDVSKGYDAVLKRRVYGALLEDMAATETVGGNLGEMVKRANAAWRTASQNIDSVQKSALGKMVGEEFATELMDFNTVAPEQIMDRLMRLRPSQAKYVAKFLDENMPDMLPQLRGSILRDAVDASMELPATAGARAEFYPGNFLRALGLTGGKRGAETMQRLMYYFNGPRSPEWKTFTDLVQLSRRLADTAGKNFSDTAAANQFFDIVRRGISSGASLFGTVGGTALEAAGLKRITQSMNPAHELFGGFNARPLLRAPRVIQGAPIPAGLAAPAVNESLKDKPAR